MVEGKESVVAYFVVVGPSGVTKIHRCERGEEAMDYFHAYVTGDDEVPMALSEGLMSHMPGGGLANTWNVLNPMNPVKKFSDQVTGIGRIMDFLAQIHVALGDYSLGSEPEAVKETKPKAVKETKPKAVKETKPGTEGKRQPSLPPGSKPCPRCRREGVRRAASFLVVGKYPLLGFPKTGGFAPIQGLLCKEHIETMKGAGAQLKQYPIEQKAKPGIEAPERQPVSGD